MSVFDSNSDVSRRAVTKGALWSVPVVSTAVSAPAYAASDDKCDVSTIQFVDDGDLPYIHGKGSSFPSDVTITATQDGSPYSGSITLTIVGDATFGGVGSGQTAEVTMTNGTLTFGTATSSSGLVVTTNSVLTSTGITVDASDDVKNFQITVQLDDCDSVTDELVWFYPNLMTWGAGTNGGLGNGGTSNTNTPGAIGPYHVWSTVDARTHAFAVTAADDTTPNLLYAWGNNSYGKVGINSTDAYQPTPVSLGLTVKDVSAGWGHSLAIGSGGRIWAWGLNSNGQLGNTSSGTNLLTPTRIPNTTSTWSTISAGHTHSAATIGSVLYTWGNDATGQLGNGSSLDDNVLQPTSISGTAPQLLASRFFTLAVPSGGGLWGCGSNGLGQLGKGNTTTGSTSLTVSTVISNLSKVSSQYEWSVGLTKASTIYAWGNNNLGQIGNNDSSGGTVPTPVDITPSGVQFSSASAGYAHGVALSDEGWLYTWGYNDTGALGNGTNTNVLVPTKVGNLQWDTVEAATSFTIGVARTFVPEGYSY
ncbi:MAG: hypothetical protein QM613_06140 [Micrococcaceae bacterium]